MAAKVYEVVPLISNFSLPGEKSPSKIGCVECSGKHLFVGTNESVIVKYIIEETPKGIHESSLNCRKSCQKFIDIKKPVRLMKASSALGKLLSLCDTTLLTLSIDTLELFGSSSRLKNVETFCINENPGIEDPFCVQICVALVSKSQVAIYNVTLEDKFSLVSTVVLEEPVTCLTADCGFICAGLRTKYLMWNYEINQGQDLFPFSTDGFSPFVCRVDKNEFLLNGPGGLGVFATTEGMSSRPPLQWSYPLISMAFHHPYIIGISHEIVMVHSVLDQQQKQAISFNGGISIGNYEGKLYISSISAVHALIPVPWEKQVEMLLSDERVDEALSLIEKVGHPSYSKEQSNQVKRRFKQQAAFILFSRGDLEEALDLFLDSEVDEREVIAIFPGLMPKSSSFVRVIPPLNQIADVVQLFHGDANKIFQAKQFLLHFLQMTHDSKRSSHLLEVDTALIKLYTELQQHKELESLLESDALVCDFRDCSEWLERHGRYHAKALLYFQEGKHENALSIWSRIISGDLVDENSKGAEFLVQILKKVDQPDLLWQYADIILDRDEVVGVQLFMHPSLSSAISSINSSAIVDFLQRYSCALILFLEYLVYEQDIKEEKFHTQLAVQYLKQVAENQLTENRATNSEPRDNLKRFLIHSNSYRTQFLLPKVRDAGLDQEVALLYGKIGEHEKALEILVNQLRDFDGAKDYCLRSGKTEDGAPNNLLHILLAIYLDPKLSDTERDDYLVPALNLLNEHAGDLDAVQVIEMIPSHWSINILDSFLQDALRSSVHKFRMCKIESALAKGNSIQEAFSLYSLQSHSMKLLDSNYCCVCKKPFSDLKFAWYPNDVVTHVECGKLSNVCPLTGRFFTRNAERPERL